jgi:hypothetical protein
MARRLDTKRQMPGHKVSTQKGRCLQNIAIYFIKNKESLCLPSLLLLKRCRNFSLFRSYGAVQRRGCIKQKAIGNGTLFIKRDENGSDTDGYH